MSASMSIGGLISGIDTNALLDQLREAAQAPIARLQSKKDALDQKAVAWAQFEAQLLGFRSFAAAFDVCTAQVSDESLATASAGASAAPGFYTFTVQSLARTHQLASQGFADTDETSLGVGTVSLAVGDADPVTIDVDGLTLAELRDAINDADAGVRAAIIDDGAEASPYRLLLTSQTSGLAGQIDAQVDLAGGSAPAFTDLQAAADAQLLLGSGAGAITITSSTNTITGAIEGVTLDLLAADPATPVTLTVARDTDAVRGRIEDLVKSFNEVAAFFADQFAFDPDSGQTGTLFGSYSLQSIQHSLSLALTNPVSGLSGAYTTLSQIGVRLAASGKLEIDSAALNQALTNDFDDVVSLLSAVGSTTDSQVAFLTGTSDTQPSGAAGWDVDITQAAARARVTAGVAQSAALAADETLTIDGVDISLSAGMTQSEVIDAINARQTQTGVIASATGLDGAGSGSYLTLTRSAYGSAYHITALSSLSNQTADTSGLGTTLVTETSPEGESGLGTGASGLDVAGTIGGQTCTGSGQRLTATEGDPTGLSLLITATAPGLYGSVHFTVGAAEAAFRASLAATDTVDGTIAREQSLLSDSAADIEAEITRMQDLIDTEQERLRASFVAMERALAQFQSQSQFLASQISQMQANAPKS